jgi:hypothetical protein
LENTKKFRIILNFLIISEKYKIDTSGLSLWKGLIGVLRLYRHCGAFHMLPPDAYDGCAWLANSLNRKCQPEHLVNLIMHVTTDLLVEWWHTCSQVEHDVGRDVL